MVLKLSIVSSYRYAIRVHYVAPQQTRFAVDPMLNVGRNGSNDGKVKRKMAERTKRYPPFFSINPHEVR